MPDTEGPATLAERFAAARNARRPKSHWERLARALKDEIDEAALDDLLDYATELFAIGLKSRHDEEGKLAIQALARIPARDPDLRPFVVALLRHFARSLFKRREGVRALRKIGGADLEDVFRFVVEDPDSNIGAREEAEAGLKEIEEAKSDV